MQYNEYHGSRPKASTGISGLFYKYRIMYRIQSTHTSTQNSNTIYNKITVHFRSQLAAAIRSSVLRQISSNGRRPLPPECHGLVDQISWLAYRQRVFETDFSRHSVPIEKCAWKERIFV